MEREAFERAGFYHDRYELIGAVAMLGFGSETY